MKTVQQLKQKMCECNYFKAAMLVFCLVLGGKKRKCGISMFIASESMNE